MFDTPMRLNFEGDVLVVTGSVDEYSLGALRRSLAEAATTHRTLRVDVSAVEFLPSAAVGVLARAWSAARDRDGELTIVAGVGCAAEQILSLTGVPYVTER